MGLLVGILFTRRCYEDGLLHAVVEFLVIALVITFFEWIRGARPTP